MGKISDNELKELAQIYNEKGKKELYTLLIEKYEIKNPTCVFNRMCKKPVLAYDKEQDCFFTEQNAVKPEDVFMSMDELCTPKTPVYPKSTSGICEQNRNEAMEKLIKELISDRLLELCKYRQIRAHCTVVECMLSGVSVHAFRYIVHVHKLAL